MRNKLKFKNVLKLSGLLAIFILPMLFAMIIFYGHSYFHFSQLNHGELISPPIQLSTTTYNELNESNMSHRWLVVQVVERCDVSCQKMQHQLLQVQKVLGNNRDRILVIQTTRKKSFPILSTQMIYLVDPLGNVFMSYPASIDPIYILEDLKKLLEVSQIG